MSKYYICVTKNNESYFLYSIRKTKNKTYVKFTDDEKKAKKWQILTPAVKVEIYLIGRGYNAKVLPI